MKHLEHELGNLQLGRASSSLVENIDVFVPTYGMKQKMKELANIIAMDAQTIKIEPRDKGVVSAVEKSVYDAQLGLSPLNQGEHILIKVPPLTQERRQELTKIVSKMGEEAKIAVRNNRHEAMNLIKKFFQDKNISETEKDAREKEAEKLVRETNDNIDNHIKRKSEEVMKI